MFFIEKYLDVKDVAIYFSAYNIYMAIVIFVTAIISSSFPKIKLLSLTEQMKSFKTYYLIYIILLLCSYGILPYVYALLFPIEYIVGAQVLFWLLCTIPFMFITYLVIFNFNYLKCESNNVKPVLFILILKLIVFLSLQIYLQNIVIFSKFYLIFESILAFIFFISMQKYSKSQKNKDK